VLCRQRRVFKLQRYMKKILLSWRNLFLFFHVESIAPNGSIHRKAE